MQFANLPTMSSRGGKREGAGRPPALDAEKMRTVSMRIPQWMVEQVDAIVAEDGGDRSFMLRYALTKTFKLKPPADVKDKFWQEWEEKCAKKRPR